MENDWAWDERREREEIKKWAFEQKEKGKRVKVGTGRVMIEGEWKLWEEVKKEKRRMDD